MFRKPLFWVVLTAVSLAGIVFTVRNFSRAFPIVSLDLRMNRAAALAQARELAARFQLPPSDFRQAASFSGNQEVQNFIELEAGGTDAFRAMIQAGLYYPYQWTVRHFKPGETRETAIRFTPGGEAYGFSIKLPEDEPGAALEPAQARATAEQSAARDWGVDLSKYQLVEESKEVKPGGRIDHTFVYERPDVQIGEGRYRLRLMVGGDRLINLTPFVKVPEAFSRRYEQLRSSNSVVEVAGVVAFLLLYGVGGCGVGLFYLLRRRWILWRKPVIWGVVIAFLQLLAGINQWPLLWISYDTAVSYGGFVLQQLLLLLLSFCGYAALFAVSFMAAESLTRQAFPQHIQLWKLWSGEAAASKAVLGRTAGGYLLVGAFFAYVVLLYFVASRALGWWTPSDVLVQPDVLANYFPWLTSIAVSAQAGFWEESLFRAVPLAGAALLGTRFGRRGWWIAGAMIVQALIFGSGHAGYATQPYYARVAELILPSMMFGGIYLVFGLLPSIVLHFTYDVVWFALPLFVSAAPGIWVDRICVIVFALLPLWVVLGARLRKGIWMEVPDHLLNREWRPREEVIPEASEERPAVRSMGSGIRRVLPIAGVAGLVVWGFATDFTSDAPPLKVSRPEAMSIARRELERRGIQAAPSGTVLTALVAQPDQQDRFIWQTAGRDVYQLLMGEYLAPPHWRVRFVRFEGDVAERAEEYNVFISGEGKVFRFLHTLPEARAGAGLPEEEARTTAQEALRTELGLDPSTVKEISAAPSKLQARTDWAFTFEAEGAPELAQGEKRIRVRLAGDEVVDAYRFVHIPEEWQRQERDRQTMSSTLTLVCTGGVVLVVIGGLIAAIVSWSRKQYVVSSFLLFTGLLVVVTVTNLVNSIPLVASQFSTAQPYRIQMFIVLAAGLIGMLLVSASMGLLAGLGHTWNLPCEPSRSGSSWITGVALGGIVAGLLALGSAVARAQAPKWADFGLLNNYSPLLANITGAVSGYFTQSILALLIFAALNRFTGQWSRIRIPSAFLLFLLGFAIAGSRSFDTIPGWLAQGAILGCIMLLAYVAVLRYSVPSSLIAVGVILILNLLKQGINGLYPMAWLGTILASMLVGLAMWFWHGRIMGGRRASSA
jgi:hypothetical protein